MQVVTGLVLAAASAVAAVHATGLSGSTCTYVTPAPAPPTTAPPAPPVNCELHNALTDPGAWGDCTDDGTGVYFRSKILSVKTDAENGGTPCVGEDDPARKVSEKCPAAKCVPLTPEEDTNPMGPCTDDGSGKFFKSKILGEKTPAQYGGTCLDADRKYSEPCDAVNCEAYTKDTDPGAFGECKDDGSGKWYRSKVLRIKTQPLYGGTPCASDEELTVSELCEPINCTAVTPEEDDGAYGECSLDKESGKYMKAKVLKMKDPAKYGGTCRDEDRVFNAPCDAIDCVPYSADEDTGDFGECVPTEDGFFSRSKVLGVKTPAQFGGTECVPESQRTVSERCPPEDCVAKSEEEDDGKYGPCMDNGAGAFFRSKVLGVKIDAKYGGDCSEGKRTVQLPCPAVNCVVYDSSEDPGPFGECEQVSGGQYFRSKVLQVQVYPQYGGRACPSKAERTFSVRCEPVKCTAVAPELDTNPFGPCTKDEQSGKYFKSKVLDVQERAQYGGSCEESDRIHAEECAAVDCVVNTPEEDTGAFGECTDSGNNGTYFFKSKVLGVKVQPLYGGNECVPESERTVSARCEPVDCVPNTVSEDTGEYGECTFDAVNGTYVKTKVLEVKEKEKYGGTCPESERTVVAPCLAVDCVVNTPEEDKDEPFGACEKDAYSNAYYKSKVLRVKTLAQYGGNCPSRAERTIKELCPAVNCVPVPPAEDTGAFGDCQKNATDGVYYKSKVLAVNEKEKYGGTCLDADRTYSEVCAPVNCVVYPPAEDPGAFGECKDSGNGTFYKSKVLRVKTQPLYGGQECVPEEQRRYFVKCDPVNCVPVPAAKDKEPFGECKNTTNGAFYQYKVLAVQTPALYGGKCDPADRTISQLCEPVPCVVYPAADDPGQFGDCKNDGSGKFYKSKVLGIKTPALYGGSCPGTTDPTRQYRVVCPAVDCVVTKEADDKRPYGSCTRFPDGKYYRTKVLPIITQAQYGGKACPSEADRTLKQLCPDDGYCLPSDPLYDTCVPKLAQCGDKVKDTVYQGNELALVTGIALWECCDMCATTAGCVAYSFTPNSNTKNNQCSLKWKIGSTSRVTGATSSVPKAVKPTKCSFYDNGFNTLPSSNIKEVTTDSLAVCCDACVNLAKCDTFNLKNSKCELKESSWANIVNYLFAGGWRAGSINN